MPTEKVFLIFCKELAWAMFIKSLNESRILVEIGNERLGNSKKPLLKSEVVANPMDRFFDTKDPKIVKIRQGCPLRFMNGKYSFYHKSFLEYFIASAIFDDLFLDEPYLELNVVNINKMYISKRLLTFEPAIIDFLAELIQGDRQKLEYLFSLVKASHNFNKHRIAIAAANAITVLNKCYFNFSGQDLNQVNITGADLRGAYCDNTNFENANLTAVNLSHIWLREANLKNAKMNDVYFNEYAYFQHKNGIVGMVYHGREKRLLTISDAKLMIWNTGTMQLIKEFTCAKDITNILDKLYCVAMDSTGKVLASGGLDNAVRIWDATTETGNMRVLGTHKSWVNSLCMSKNGKWLVSGGNDELVIFWEIDSAVKVELKGHESAVACVSMSDDAKIVASGGWDGDVRVWNIRTRSTIRVLSGHSNWVMAVRVSADGKKIASGSKDNTVRLWDIENGNSQQFIGHEDWVCCVDLSADNQTLVSGSWDLSVRVWNVVTQQSKVMRGHTDVITSVQLSDDEIMQTVLSSSWDQKVRVWGVSDNQLPLKNLRGHTKSVNSVHISKNADIIASGSEDGTIRVWNRTESHNVVILRGHTDHVTAIQLSENGEWLISGSLDHSIRLWDIKTGITIKALHHTEAIYSICYYGDGQKVVFGGTDNAVRTWTPETNECITHFEAVPTKAVMCVHMCADKTRVAAASHEKIFVWDALNQKIVRVIKATNGNIIKSIFLSSDGKKVVSGSWDRAVAVFNVETGENECTLIGHAERVECVLLSSDDKTVYSGGMDNTLRIWDIVKGAPSGILYFTTGIASLTLHENPKENSKLLIIGFKDGAVQIWQHCKDNWHLYWSSAYPNPMLNLKGCDWKGASEGLSEVNFLLMTQRTDTSPLEIRPSTRSEAPINYIFFNEAKPNDVQLFPAHYGPRIKDRSKIACNYKDLECQQILSNNQKVKYIDFVDLRGGQKTFAVCVNKKVEALNQEDNQGSTRSISPN